MCQFWTIVLENVPTLIETFMADMNRIKSRFPSQTTQFWKIVLVSLKRIIKENYPDYPAVLLLVVPLGSQSSKTGTCIAKQLTKIVNTLYNVVGYPCKLLRSKLVCSINTIATFLNGALSPSQYP
jgi:hypothetical protein